MRPQFSSLLGDEFFRFVKANLILSEILVRNFIAKEYKGSYIP